jgi:hypothetical protein
MIRTITIVIDTETGTVRGDLDDVRSLWPAEGEQTTDGQARSIFEQALSIICAESIAMEAS